VSRKDKKPAIAVALPKAERKPRVAGDGENSDSKHPIWCLGLMDFDGPWPWTIDATTMREIHSKLVAFERMTWAAISGHRHHFLTSTSLCKAAKDRLIAIKLDDAVDRIYSLALSGVERLIGIRLGREFHFLWWDPRHEVCPSQKKNT